jgi:undecaprenyl-diphosphatase
MTDFHPMALWQALVLSVLQGASELFPVSSLGHAVIVPALLHWKNAAEILDSNGPFLPFLVTLHLGTALALLIFYWKEWKRLIAAFFQQFSAKGAIAKDAYLINLVLLGTIPTGLIGFVAEKRLRGLFSSPLVAGAFLIVNGVMMIVAERMRRRAEDEEIEIYGEVTDHKPMADLTWVNALWIGLMQSLALLPGMSRSGATITGGLIAKMNHEDAAKFSFLLATPIILAAGLKEVPKLVHPANPMPHMLAISLIGFVVAGVTAYLSVRFLTRFFQTKRMDIFGYYCIALGAVTFAAMAIHH